MKKRAKVLVEQVVLAVSVTAIVAAARRDGEDVRSAGFVTPIRAAPGTWVKYETILDEGVARIDTRLQDGSEIGTIFEVFSERVGDHADGRRRWKAGCPGCGLPTRHLFVESYSAPRFGCRSCLRLGYRSQRHRPAGRAAFLVQALRERAGGSRGPIFAPFPEKEPRMRWATWLDLERRAMDALAVYNKDAARRRARTRERHAHATP